MYRNLIGIVAVFVVALLLVDLTFTSAKEEPPDFAFVNGTEPKTLDPQKMTGQPEGRIAESIFEGLTFRPAKTLQSVPGSAVSWTVSDDGLVWTFKMREGIVWSNEDPLDARDFVYAWKRLQEPKTASEYAYLLHCVRHAEAYNTYAAHVKALRGDPNAEEEKGRLGVVARLRALTTGTGKDGSLTAKDWQAFVEGSGLREAVIGTRDPALLAALAKESGTLATQETSAVLVSLEAEAERRAAALADAQAHFGKDQGVYAPDAKTFVVELRSFTPYFLELTSFYPTFPVHRATVEAHPMDWFLPATIVSNGPYVLTAWTVNDKMRMVKSDRYWAASEVATRVVDAYALESSTTALNLFSTDVVQWAPSGFPLELIDQVKVLPEYYANPGMVVYYYRLNCTKPGLSDPRVRRALGLAFDRRLLVEQVTRGGQIPTATFVAPGIPGYASPESGMGLDVAKARALLAEAGYPGGKGFPKLSLVFNTLEAHKKIADYVTHQWRTNLGIDAVPVNQEWQSYQESVRRLDYDVARAAWIGDYRDPNTFLDMWITGGGNNQTGWGDPFYDRLLQLCADPFELDTLAAADREALLARTKERAKVEALLATLAATKAGPARLAAAAAVRLQLFREAEAILLQEAFPVLPIYFYVVSGMVSQRVGGFYSQLDDGQGGRIPNLQDIHPIRDIRVLPRGERAR